MEERKLCEDCGTKLASDATSCPTCGLDLEVQGQWEERVTETMVEEAFPLPPEHARGGDVDERRGRIGSRDYASFGARLVAYILDTILTTAVNYGLQVAALIALSVLLGSDLGLDDDGLLGTFNSGIGMVLLVEADQALAACDLLTALGEQPAIIGEVVRREGTGSPQVVFA